MSDNRLSVMSDHAVQGILDLSRPVSCVPTDLAQAWPQAAALEVGLAMCTACDAIEQMYAPPPAIAMRVLQAWRLAALVGGDVIALQALGRPHSTAAHLLAWWTAPDA